MLVSLQKVRVTRIAVASQSHRGSRFIVSTNGVANITTQCVYDDSLSVFTIFTSGEGLRGAIEQLGYSMPFLPSS